MEESKEMTQKKKQPGAAVCLVLGIILFTAAVLSSLVMVVPALFRMQNYVVASGSMEPTMPVGSLIFARKVDPQDLEVGDIIVFETARGTGEKITHRVVENDQTAREITTKGDANEAQDPTPVTYDRVVGRVIRHIPKIGSVVMQMQAWYGKVLIIGVLILGFALIEVGLRGKEKKKEE